MSAFEYPLRRLVTLLIVGGAVGAAVVVSVCSLIAPLCADAEILRRESPDRQYVAYVLRRDCGATTDFVTHILLERQAGWFRRGATVLSVAGSPEVSLTWASPTELAVALRKCARDPVYQRTATWRNVRLTYREGSPLEEGPAGCPR